MQFIQSVLTQNIVTQLSHPFDVEGEATDLAFHFSVLGLVTVVLRTARAEFHNVITFIQFVLEVAEISTSWGVQRRVARTMEVDDRVGVEVEDAFAKMIERSIETESGMTGGEGGYEDVEIG